MEERFVEDTQRILKEERIQSMLKLRKMKLNKSEIISSTSKEI